METPTTPPGSGVPDAAPAAAAPARIRPGRIWYLVALLVFLGGVAWLMFGLFSLASHIDSFPRVAVPAGGQVSLGHAGGYVVYYEGPGAQSGRIPAFRVRVIPASASAAVQSLTPYSTTVTYSFGSHQGRAVLTLRVSRPGRFTVETPGANSLPPGAGLAFGDSIVGGIAGTAVLSGLLILAGLAGLVLILILRILKTSRARSAAPAWSPPAAQPATPPAAQPATPAEQPATPADQPATPADQPATPADQPATPADQPATPADQPATPPAPQAGPQP